MRVTFILVMISYLTIADFAEEDTDQLVEQYSCKKPEGYDGDSYTEGCLKHTCKSGVWRTSLDQNLCCYQREAFKPGSTITTSPSADGCATTSIVCEFHNNIARAIIKHNNWCAIPSYKNSDIDLVEKMGHIEEKADRLVEGIDLLEKKIDKGKVSMAAFEENIASIEEKFEKLMNLFEATDQNKTEGILIAGGTGAENSVEVYIPDTGESCSLPSLPEARVDHTVDTIPHYGPVICGGRDSPTTCLHMTDSGTWENLISGPLGAPYTAHTSWSSSAGLYLMGGDYTGLASDLLITSERTGLGPYWTKAGFTLHHSTRFACSITDEDTVIITGGKEKGTRRLVVRYNQEGYVESLPMMDQGRYKHGCGSYYNHMEHTKVLIVAGGYCGYCATGSSGSLSSAEKLNIGDGTWVSMTPLPRPLYGVASLSMDNTIYLSGGRDEHFYGDMSTDIFQLDGDGWKVIGNLQRRRRFHAMAKVDEDIMKFCI